MLKIYVFEIFYDIKFIGIISAILPKAHFTIIIKTLNKLSF